MELGPNTFAASQNVRSIKASACFPGCKRLESPRTFLFIYIIYIIYIYIYIQSNTIDSPIHSMAQVQCCLALCAA